jgi:hypothetical protein
VGVFITPQEGMGTSSCIVINLTRRRVLVKNISLTRTNRRRPPIGQREGREGGGGSFHRVCVQSYPY